MAIATRSARLRVLLMVVVVAALNLVVVFPTQAAPVAPPTPNWRLTNPNVTVAFLNEVVYSSTDDIAVAVGSVVDSIQSALVVQQSASKQSKSWFSGSIPITSAYFPSITYNDSFGFIAAIGESLVVSYNGNNWLPVNLGYYLNNIANGNGIIMALSSDCSQPAKVAISETGLTWNLVDAPFTCDSAYYDVYFINGYFYSMGETVIWRTENGYNWTEWSHTWNKIAPEDSLAIGIAAGIPASSTAPTPMIISTLFVDLFQTLDDGVTWKAIYRPKGILRPVGEQGFGAINVFNGNYYYNIGNGRTLVSTDLGVSWSLASPPLQGFPYKFASSAQEDLYIAVGPNGLIQSSDDGQSWNTVNEGIADQFTGFVVDTVHSQFVLSTLGGIYVMTPPSTQWTMVQMDSTLAEGALVWSTYEGSPTGVIWGNFYPGYDTVTFSYSFDLINWVSSSASDYAQGLYFTGLAFSPSLGVWVISYEYFGYRQSIFVSTDYTGSDWKVAIERFPPYNAFLSGPVYGDDMFILTSSKGDIYTSDNGFNWTTVQCTTCPSGTLKFLGDYLVSYYNGTVYYTTSDALNSWSEFSFTGSPPRVISTLEYFEDLGIYAIAVTFDESSSDQGCVWYYATTPAGPWIQPQGDLITTQPGCVSTIAYMNDVYVALNFNTNQIYIG